MPNSDVVYIMRSSGRTVCKFKVNGISKFYTWKMRVRGRVTQRNGRYNDQPQQENSLPVIVQVPPGSRHGHETSGGVLLS